MADKAPTTPSDLVSVIGRYQLQCADNEALWKIESPFHLGPLDHMVFRCVPINVLFAYEPPTSDLQEGERISVSCLREALCRLLDYYPHLTGRLHFDTETNAPSITALGTGAELIEARCSKRLDDEAFRGSSGRILVTHLPGSGETLVAPFDSTTEGVCRDPILSVKHTRFACGGVVLGIRVHHIVCDAHGFFNLVNDLAEIYCGFRSGSHASLSQPPDIRSILRGSDALSPEQQRASRQYQPSVYYTKDDPRLASLSAAALDDAPPAAVFEVSGRILRFSSRDLAALKEKATDPSSGSWVSSTEALSAYLCQRVYQALQSQGVSLSAARAQTPPGFWISMDMRGPDRLNLNPRYFPNCIYPPYTNELHSSLADCTLPDVARSVHDLIRSVDPERMMKTTEWIAAQPDKSDIRVGFIFGRGSFTVSQWSKMDMYKGNHFEVTKNGNPVLPSLVSPPFTDVSRVDGLAMLLATDERAVGQPSIDVNLSVIQPLWDILDADDEFRKYYS